MKYCIRSLVFERINSLIENCTDIEIGIFLCKAKLYLFLFGSYITCRENGVIKYLLLKLILFICAQKYMYRVNRFCTN